MISRIDLFFCLYLLCVTDTVHGGIRIYPKLGVPLFYTGRQPDTRIGEARIDIKSDLTNTADESYFATIHADFLKLLNQSIYFADRQGPTTLISVGSIDPKRGVPITFGKTIRIATAEASKLFYIGVQQDGVRGRATIIGMETEDNNKVDKEFSEIQKELLEKVKKPIFGFERRTLLLSVGINIEPNGVSITFGIVVHIKTDAESDDMYEGTIKDTFTGQATITGSVGKVKDINTIREELLGRVNEPMFAALAGKLLLSVGEVDKNGEITITYGIPIRFTITSSFANEYYVGRQQVGKDGQIMVYGMVKNSGEKISKDIGEIRAVLLELQREAKLYDGCYGKVFLAVGEVDLNGTVQITYGTPVCFTADRTTTMFYMGYKEETEVGKAKITGKATAKAFPVQNISLKSLANDLDFVKSDSKYLYQDGEHTRELLSVKEVDGAVLITYEST